MKYGSSVVWSYAPKSDARAILFLLFILATSFTYFAQYQRWNTIANHVIKAAVEDWSTSQGGSSESMAIRKKALEMLDKKQQEEEKPTTQSVSNRQAKKNAKLSKQEKKKKEQEELKKIVEVLVHEIDDFGAGFHKPTMKDLFIFKLIKLPLHLAKAVAWRAKFYFNRLRRLPYSPEEIEMMTRISVGEIGWEAANEEEKKRMLTLELWEPSNLEEWREDQKVKMLSSGEQKRLARAKKKQGKNA